MGILGLGKKRGAARALDKVLHGAEPPSFPALTLRIMEKLRDPEVEFEELSEAIRWDVALTMKLLATVNSAAFGPKCRIEDVRHAISYLGRGQLENLVLAVAVRDILPASSGPGFDVARFWRTAAQRAALARTLAGKLHPAREGEAFTAALLLDLAVPVLADRLGAPYLEVLEEWHESPGARLDELEQTRFGRSHAKVGSLLANLWDLPESLSRTIEMHHESSATDADVLPAVRLVALAREVDAASALEVLVELGRSDYGLEPDWTVESIEASRDKAEELAALLSSG